MKKYSIFALALVMGAMTLTSCEDAFGNFLDKQPSNELTKAEVLGNFTLLEENHNDTLQLPASRCQPREQLMDGCCYRPG